MSTVGQPERAAQNRVIAVFRNVKGVRNCDMQRFRDESCISPSLPSDVNSS